MAGAKVKDRVLDAMRDLPEDAINGSEIETFNVLLHALDLTRAPVVRLLE